MGTSLPGGSMSLDSWEGVFESAGVHSQRMEQEQGKGTHDHVPPRLKGERYENREAESDRKGEA